MASSSRSGSLLVVAAGILAMQGCASSRTEPQGCQGPAECSPGSRCVSGTCVANSAPSASIAPPPGALEANLVLGFDASGSADPDPGDSVATYAWTFRAVAASCAPPVVAGTGPVAQVRFACPGTFAVDLTVTDQLGATATATRELLVAPYSGPSLLVIGPDVSVGHLCTGGGTRCADAGPIALSASATADAPAGLTWLWTVEPPPGLALDANRRVTFTPGADAPSPTVSIETDGQAIAGDWIFRVEARDAAGVVASGATRVSVGNRPPVLVRTIPVPDHTFDGTAFAAAGAVPFTVSDPDGDALVGPTAEWRHVGDGPGGVFVGAVLAGSVTFAISVPYAGPADAQYLIGGPQLERSIVFSVSDVNGAAVSETWPILVGNRPPALLSGPAVATVNHLYDAATLRYLADATVESWTDPDGDPLSPLGPTGSSVCSSYDVVNGDVVVHCSASYPGAPRLSSIVGVWPVSVGVKDPWTPAGPATAYVEVVNRPPRLATTAVSRAVACLQGGCCRTNIDLVCTAWYKTFDSEILSFGGVVADDDGDPLNVLVNGSPLAPCAASTCAISGWVSLQGPVCGSGTATDAWTVEVSDSGATATGTVTITRRC